RKAGTQPIPSKDPESCHDREPDKCRHLASIIHDGSSRNQWAEHNGLAPTSAAVPVPLRSHGDRRREEGRQSPAVRRGSVGRAHWPKACRSSGSAIVAAAFMINSGYTSTGLDGDRAFVWRSLTICPSWITISRAA